MKKIILATMILLTLAISGCGSEKTFEYVTTTDEYTKVESIIIDGVENECFLYYNHDDGRTHSGYLCFVEKDKAVWFEEYEYFDLLIRSKELENE